MFATIVCALWIARPEVSTVGLGDADPGQVRRALTRSEAWGLLGLLALFVSVGRAARSARAFGAGDALWASTGRVGPWSQAGAAFLGEVLGFTLWLCVFGAWIEVSLPESSNSWQELGALAPLARAQTDAGEARWTVDPGATTGPASTSAGERVSVSWSWLGDYSPLECVRLVARRGPESRSASARPQLAQRVEVELPPGAGPVQLELQAVGAERALGIARLATARLRPASERLASLQLALRWLCVGALLIAAAQGLGAWMEPTIAASLLIVLWGVAALESGQALLPGTDLEAAFELTSQGRVPPPLAARTWLALPLWVLAALALRVGALRRGLPR